MRVGDARGELERGRRLQCARQLRRPRVRMCSTFCTVLTVEPPATFTCEYSASRVSSKNSVERSSP